LILSRKLDGLRRRNNIVDGLSVIENLIVRNALLDCQGFSLLPIGPADGALFTMTGFLFANEMDFIIYMLMPNVKEISAGISPDPIAREIKKHFRVKGFQLNRF
jgi:hypothetical protein